MPAGPMASSSLHFSRLRKCAKHFSYDRGSSQAGDGGLPIPQLPHITPHLFHNIPHQASHTAYTNYSSLHPAFGNVFLSLTHTFYKAFQIQLKKYESISWCFLFHTSSRRSSPTIKYKAYELYCSDHDYAACYAPLCFPVRSSPT